MNVSRRSRAVSLFICGLICLTIVAGAVSGDVARSAEVPANQSADAAAPYLTLQSYAEDEDVLTVRGRGFTPGGKVYFAIYDQMGKQLYEHRWATASARIAAYETAIRSEYADKYDERIVAGTVAEQFTGLCGASAMIRALDDATERWTGFQVVTPVCGRTAAPTIANDLLRPESLPQSGANSAWGTIIGDLNAVSPPALLSTSDTPIQGNIVVHGAGFTAGGRVYVAIYDQMGALLFETRWTKATPPPSIYAANARRGYAGTEGVLTPGGELHEAFAGLCGAQVLIRAFNAETAVWSSWLAAAPLCELAPQGYGPH